MMAILDESGQLKIYGIFFVIIIFVTSENSIRTLTKLSTIGP